jgi:FkbM family methyltransferase
MKASEILQLTYLIDFVNLNILECGACHADETIEFCSSNNCYYIEANPDDFTSLKKQNLNVSNYALTNHNNLVEFTITSHAGNSSLCHSELHIEELTKYYNSVFTKTTVQGITYKNYIENIAKKNIDILVLDIEGHESTVLETFRELQPEQLPKIICIEVGYDWSERKRLLIELGYVLDFYESNNCYVSHSACNIKKNVDSMRIINLNNREFVWHNKVIYTNELVA